MRKILSILFTLFCFLPIQAKAIPPTDAELDILTASWDAPTTRTDGTELLASELDKYILYCGSTARADVAFTDYENVYEILGGTVTSYVAPLSKLQTYYCSITAVDIDGAESQYSNEVRRKALPNPPARLAR